MALKTYSELTFCLSAQDKAMLAKAILQFTAANGTYFQAKNKMEWHNAAERYKHQLPDNIAGLWSDVLVAKVIEEAESNSAAKKQSST